MEDPSKNFFHPKEKGKKRCEIKDKVSSGIHHMIMLHNKVSSGIHHMIMLHNKVSSGIHRMIMLHNKIKKHRDYKKIMSLLKHMFFAPNRQK